MEVYWGDDFVCDATVAFDEVTARGKTIPIVGAIHSGSGTRDLTMRISKDRPGTISIGWRKLNPVIHNRSIPS